MLLSDRKAARKNTFEMGMFPTRILLATDGSEEAELAALRAVDLAQSTDSEPHVAHVGVIPSFLRRDPGTLGDDGKLGEQIEEDSRELLRKLSWRVKVAGATVARTYLRMGAVDLEIVGLAKELGADLIVMCCRGHRGIRRAIEGHLRCGYPPRSLPSASGTLARERPDS